MDEAFPLFAQVDEPRCKRCGKVLVQTHGPGRPKSSWCSWECKRPGPQERACEGCGKRFTPGHGATRFCAPACREAAQRERYYGKLREKTCAVCGCIFSVRRGDRRRACSPACSVEVDARWRAGSPTVRADRLVRMAKRRAERKGLPCALDRDAIARRIAAGRCEVTGVPFDLSLRRDRTQHVAPFAPSIDRIDPARGYTMDNVQIVAWAYNAAKATGTHQDVVALARAVVAAERRKSNVFDSATG